MNKRAMIQFWAEFCTSFSCMIIANIVSYFFLRYAIHRLGVYSLDSWFSYSSILVLSSAVTFIGFHKNLDLTKRNRRKELISVFKNTTLTYMLVSALMLLTKNEIIDSRYFFLTGYVLSTIFMTISKYFLKRLLTNNFTNSKNASIAGVITTSDIAADFIDGIKSDWSIRISSIALLDEFCTNGIYDVNNTNCVNGCSNATTNVTADLPDSIDDIPVVATDETFIDWIRSAPLDEVFINLPYEKAINIQELVEELEDMGITVHINVPTLDNLLGNSKFDNISFKVYSNSPMATFTPATYNSRDIIGKRIFDIVLGSLGLICSIPIILITAIPLLIESPGPLIFKQQRVGKNGRLFNIYKIRSMYVDAEERKAELMEQNKMEGLMFKVDDDPRITKVGKFIRKYSIDELPQFFNVVKGDMSLIGTRTPTVDEFEQYESRHKRRLSMRPGITGMWQVSGRSDIQDFEEVVKLDCEYIDNWSPALDIKILFKTVGVVLTHKGAE